MKTRGKGSTKTAAEAIAATASTEPKIQLSPESKTPPHVIVLPKDISTEARVVTIVHPRHSGESRYICCPRTGFYEFKKFAAPKSSPRSWLLVPSKPNDESLKKQIVNESIKENDGEFTGAEGYVKNSAEMFIATPMDPLFLILPFLAPPASSKSSEPSKRLFLSSDDYFDSLTAQSPQLRPFLCTPSIQDMLEARMAAVCDTVAVGDETMYRLNESKLLQELLQKAQKTAQHGLPASMEEKFVRRALEVPLQSIKREEGGGREEAAEGSSSGATLATTDNLDSQTTDSFSSFQSTASSSTAATSLPAREADNDPPPQTSKTTDSEAPSAADSIPPAISAPDGIPHLLRIRVALDFIITSYLPASIQTSQTRLLSSLSSSSSSTSPSSPASSSPLTTTLDFTPLTTHLSHLSALRTQAQASRSLLSDPSSRKRSLYQEGEEQEYDALTGESRKEKKQKREEEERRKKAGESRGVRDLKKVDVKGMKKMSDFFKKG